MLRLAPIKNRLLSPCGAGAHTVGRFSQPAWFSLLWEAHSQQTKANYIFIISFGAGQAGGLPQ